MLGEKNFQEARDFSEGLARVRTPEGWGFIDRTGNMVIEPQFDRADDFQNDLALVAVAGKQAYITKAGAFVGDQSAISSAIQTRNQKNIIGSLRTLNTAEITYSTAYGSGFSPDLISLAPPKEGGANPSSGSAGLIDFTLASGIKHGYRFTYQPQPKDSSGRITGYTIHADPANSGVTGTHYFTNESGVIRQNDSGPAGPDSPFIENTELSKTNENGGRMGRSPALGTTATVVARGGGILTAPGTGNHECVVNGIDTRQFPNGGILTIDITLGPGESSASFELFAQGANLPARGFPNSSANARDLAPGARTSIVYPFSSGQIFTFCAEGNWLSRKGSINTYSFVASAR
jgi:hypothetical protein